MPGIIQADRKNPTSIFNKLLKAACGEWEARTPGSFRYKGNSCPLTGLSPGTPPVLKRETGDRASPEAPGGPALGDGGRPLEKGTGPLRDKNLQLLGQSQPRLSLRGHRWQPTALGEGKRIKPAEAHPGPRLPETPSSPGEGQETALSPGPADASCAFAGTHRTTCTWKGQGFFNPFLGFLKFVIKKNEQNTWQNEEGL